MKFALFTSMGNTSWDELRTLWDYAEAAGWDAACVTDHFMPNTADRVGDTIECWTALAALATTTKRMRIGTIVTGNTYRHPAVLAKMAANVDIISGGRLICGMGAGWQENEHRAYGIEFYTVRERLDRLDEACRVTEGPLDRAQGELQGPLLPARGRAADAQARAAPVSRIDDRRRRREGDAAHRGPARRSLEHLGRARDPRPQGPHPRRALQDRGPRSQDDSALGGDGSRASRTTPRRSPRSSRPT